MALADSPLRAYIFVQIPKFDAVLLSGVKTKAG